MKTIKEFNEIEQLKIKKVMLMNGMLDELTSETLIEMKGRDLIRIVNSNDEYLFENNKVKYPF